MSYAVVITMLLFLGTLTLHCTVMKKIRDYLAGNGTLEFLKVCLALAMLHAVEVGAYAAGFSAGQMLGIGTFKNAAAMSVMDTFYFSLVNFTTLGLGEVFPSGHLRFIAGFEAFNGFLCITMSASVLFNWIHNNE